MLSPAIAPSAAATATPITHGCPVETPTAARATTTDSLGIGGKNPSMQATSRTTR
jgi:hypothetical protein